MFVILLFEYPYLRELLMQCACYEKGACKGGSSFEQLLILQNLSINNGQVLVDGEISKFWMDVQFWRTVLAISLHYLQILIGMSQSHKLGYIANNEIKVELVELLERE